jgi:hypothetical protein
MIPPVAVSVAGILRRMFPAICGDETEEPEAEPEEEECRHCGWSVSQCICDAPGGDL